LSAAVKDVGLKVTNAELITALQKLPPETPALRGDPEWRILHVKDVQLKRCNHFRRFYARSVRRLRRAS
jgi:hypothetical protein